MTLSIYNTLTKKVEPFSPILPGKVTFYSCGPTVYDYAHIGNFRSFLAADLLRRYLESPFCNNGEGYDVTHVMNMTDVGHMTDDEVADGAGEDKMDVARRRMLEDKKSGKLPAGADIDPNNPLAVAEFYIAAFLHDSRTLGLKVAIEYEHDHSLMPRPTEYIDAMIAHVRTLIDRGHAYIASDGVVYFDVQSFPQYGKLSGNTLDKLRSGAGGRVSDDALAVKKHPADFLLWKPDKTHLMRWPSPWGEGYPGWHLECSVMAHDLLGRETNGVIDIHSGGEDNLFPHHECEIAQSCGASGEDYFARYWFHPRHLFVEGEKMSKSKGTFFTVEQLLDKGFSPAAIRLELIKTHYRSNANFTMQGLRDSAKMVKRWRDARIEIARRSTGWKDKDNRIVAHRLNHSLERAMNDDLNIAGAIGTINGFINTAMTWETHFDAPEPTREEAVKRIELAKAVPPAGADGFVDVFSWIGPVLGVFDVEHEALAASDVDESKIEALIAERAAVRKAKDWTRADAIRDELDAMGIELVDTSQGTTWKHKTPN